MTVTTSQIPNLPAATSLSTADLVAVVQGGTLKRADLGLFSSITGGLIVTQNVADISAMQALPKAELANETLIFVAGYAAPSIYGGGLFLWLTGSTATTDGGTIFASNEGGTGRWFRIYDGTVTPYMFGANSGGSQPDQYNYLAAMHNAINTNSAINSADVVGVWPTSGNLPAITVNNFTYLSSGFAKFIRLSSGVVLRFTGNYADVRFIEVDGGGFDISPIRLQGNYPFAFRVKGYNTGSTGQGISVADGVDGATLIACEAYSTAKGGIGIGKTTHSMVALCRVHDTGAEGIPSDVPEKNMLIANQAYNCAGAGGFATDYAFDCGWVANIVWSSHNGLATVDHRWGSNYNTVIGNIFSQNDHWGVWVKNNFASVPITAVTNANPGVMTVASLAITGATNALPCVITCVAHGLSTGDRRKINNVGGMTQLNGNIYRLKKLSANTLELHDTDTWAGIDSTAYGVYTAGGTLDHPFAQGDNLYPAAVGGMVEIQRKTSATAAPDDPKNPLTVGTLIGVNQFQLWDINDNPLDTSGYTAYTSGGFATQGGVGVNMTVIGNVMRSNNDGQILISSPLPVSVGSNNIILGNQAKANQSNYQITTDAVANNWLVVFNSAVTSGGAAVTGNGAAYTMLAQNIQDTAQSYDDTTGKFTCPSTGHYYFNALVGVSGMGGGTGGTVEIQIVDQYGTAVQTFRGLLLPTGGDKTLSVWRGNANGDLWLESGSVAKVVVTGTGLAGNTASLVTDGTSTFNGGLRA